MKIPDDVLELIQAEQNRQNGKFIPSNQTYLKKLSANAELAVHYIPEGLAGFIFFYCNHPEKKFTYITLIGTSSDYRNKGIGSALVNHVLSISKHRGFSECRLEVLKFNKSALSLYKKSGFEILEDRIEKLLLVAKIE